MENFGSWAANLSTYSNIQQQQSVAEEKFRSFFVLPISRLNAVRRIDWDGAVEVRRFGQVWWKKGKCCSAEAYCWGVFSLDSVFQRCVSFLNSVSVRRDGVRKNGEKFEELTGRFSWIKFCLLFGSPSICWIFQCVSTVNLSLNPFPRLWCVWLFSGCFNRYDSSRFWLIMMNDRQKMVKSYCFWIKKCTKWKRKSSRKKKKKNPPFTPYSWLKKKNEWKVYKKNPVSYISQVKTKNIVKAIKQEEKNRRNQCISSTEK